MRILILLSVFYALGVVGHAIPALLPWMLLVTPWFLLASGGIALIASWQVDRRSLLLWFVPVLLITFLLEVAGVSTGLIFGHYHYTPVLGTSLFGVPPVIGWNWVLVVLGVHSAFKGLFPHMLTGVRVVAVALICVGFDLLLEPVAMSLGYWVWDGVRVPLQNYIAWGTIAAAASWWAEAFPRLRVLPLLGWYVLLQAGFFLALGVMGVRA